MNEYSLSETRNLYRKRRNILRRLLLVLFVLIMFLLIQKSFYLQRSLDPKIEIVNNKLIKTSYIVDFLSKELNKKNFFSLSTRDISKKLCNMCPLLKNIVIRKYLYPEFKIIAFVKSEDKIWGAIKSSYNNSGQLINYITIQGNEISSNVLNIDLLPKNIIHLYLDTNISLSKDKFIELYKIIDYVKNKTYLKLEKVLINKNSELNIFTPHFYIKFGCLSDDPLKKLNWLVDSLKLVNDKQYVIEYLDLTLESGAVFKETKPTQPNQ